jgi:hypothetical protein
VRSWNTTFDSADGAERTLATAAVIRSRRPESAAAVIGGATSRSIISTDTACMETSVEKQNAMKGDTPAEGARKRREIPKRVLLRRHAADRQCFIDEGFESEARVASTVACGGGKCEGRDGAV